MAIEDLGPAEHLSAGAIGEPGRRRFYLEVVAGGVRHSLAAEKEQISALAQQGLALLAEADVSFDEEAVSRLLASGLDVVDPDEERLRIGSIALGVGTSDLVTITVESADEDDGVTFVVAPEQFRAMAEVALEVVAGGRPICQWCRLPMDPAGHACPARN